MQGKKEPADKICRGTLRQQRIEEADQDSKGLEKLSKVEVY